MTDSCHTVRIVHIVMKDCMQSVWLYAIFYFSVVIVQSSLPGMNDLISWR